MNDYIERNRNIITNSKLKTFRYCHYLYKLQYLDEVVPQKQNDNFDVGSAFDARRQSEKKYHNEFEVVTRRSKEDTGVIQLTKRQGETIDNCMTETRRQPNFDTTGYKPQQRVEVKYRSIIIGGTMDWINKDKTSFMDDKTAGSIQMFERDWMMEYKENQLAFYSLLLSLEFDQDYDGILAVVTKEDIPKSEFYFAHRDDLRSLRGGIIQLLDHFIEVMEGDVYASSDRKKCLKCPAYSVCPYSIRKRGEFIPL